MVIVGPLRVEAEALLCTRSDHARIVQIALGDAVDLAPELACACVYGGVEILQERLGRGIDDRVHGIDAQAVDVKLVDPLQRVVDEEPAHVVAVRAVEVERRTPGRRVARGEVRAVFAQVVSLGAEVVVDDVEKQGETALMTGIDKPLERARTAVRRLRGADVRSVVAPVARAGKLRDRHQLDGGDAEVFERIEMWNDRVERPFVGERADVQLVENVVLERDAAPAVVVPFEIAGDDF